MAKASVIQNTSKKFAEIIKQCHLYESKVTYINPISSLVMYDVPFKIRIKNITVPGYSPSNVPPIGIAIIGFNNYIL